MAKWQLVDSQDAPEDLSGMTDDAKEKLDILRALVPGKAIVVEVEDTTKQKGYKAALSRLATQKLKIAVRVWSNGSKVCVELVAPAKTQAEN